MLCRELVLEPRPASRLQPSPWWRERMNESAHPIQAPMVKPQEPSAHQYRVVHAGGILGALLLGGVSLALDWSRAAMLLGGLGLVAIYVPVAVGYLFRSERRP